MTTPVPTHHHDGLITRRSIFIGAAASLFCAPAIVRAASLMPIKGVILPTMEQLYPGPHYEGWIRRLMFDQLEKALRRGWDKQLHRSSVPGLSEVDAKRTVAYARHFGFLPKLKDGFYVEG